MGVDTPLRKRDRFLQHIRRVSTPTSTARASPPGAIPSPTSKGPVLSIFDRALERLSTSERAIILEHLPSGTLEVEDAVDQAYDVAIQCRQTCGRSGEFSQRNKADKIIKLLDNFKSIGDVIANVDPVHVGLPWAGVRMVLQVALAESRQRAALLTGMDLVLGVGNKLKVYLLLLQVVKDGQAKDNFERELVDIYALVFGFLARAIELSGQNIAQRVLGAMWSDESLRDFEEKSDTLAQRTEIAANRCEEEMQRDNWRQATKWMNDIRRELSKLEEIRDVSQAMARLHTKVDLSKLSSVDGATFDSYDESLYEKHLAGTRVELLDQIMAWSRHPDSRCIFWLCGKAGTGKSTVARAIADQFKKDGVLGATFFFKRTVDDRARAKRFFSTIAKQLADVIPGVANAIAEALEKDSMLCERNLQNQFDQLVYQPLMSAGSGRMPSQTLALVIDAVDECSNETDVKTLLKLLAQLRSASIPHLRIFVTSRPELPVELGFRGIDGTLHEDVILEEVQAATIERDLFTYFRHRLDALRADENATSPHDKLPPHWPGDSRITSLVTLTKPLFIAAFTVCQYISQSEPQVSLDTILGQQPQTRFASLATVYTPVLNRILEGKTARQREEMILSFRQIVGPLVLLGEPLSVRSLSLLLGIPQRQIWDILKHLRSVLDISSDRTVPIRIFHLSFREFLIDSALMYENEFWIDAQQTSRSLATRCIHLLSDGSLRRDICEFGDPGVSKARIDQNRVRDYISEPVAYACRYWITHACDPRDDSTGTSSHAIVDGGQVHLFLQKHLLNWLEVMSWIGRVSEAINLVSTLESKVRSNLECGELTRFLVDTRKFALRYRYIIEAAPLQLYLSAIIFTPTESVIKKTFEHSIFPTEIVASPKVESDWDPETLRLQAGARFAVRTLVFSHDGERLASGSSDTLRLWDVSTGSEIQELETHGRHATSVAFSPENQILAACKTDDGLVIWDAATGRQLDLLAGRVATQHPPGGAILFSANGKLLVTLFLDGKVRLWSSAEKKEIPGFEVRRSEIHRMALTPDGSILAIEDCRAIITLWNTTSGFLLRTLYHDILSDALSLSCDGTSLASTHVLWAHSFYEIWDVRTGRLRQGGPPSARCGSSSMIAFSPVHQILATISGLNSLDLYDVIKGAVVQKVSGSNSNISALSFSPDGRTLASAAGKSAIRLSDVSATTNETITLEEKVRVSSVMFSSNGQMLLSTHKGAMPQVWSTSTCEGVKIQYPVSAIKWSPDGRYYATEPSGANVVQIRRTSNDDVVHTFESNNILRSFTYSTRRKIFIAVHGNGVLTARNLATDRETDMILFLENENIRDVALSSDGKKVALAYASKITVRDLTAKTTSKTLRHGADIGGKVSIRFSSAGDHIIVEKAGGVFGIYSIETGKIVEIRDWEETTAFPRNGNVMAIGTSDSLIRLIDTTSGFSTRELKGHSNVVTALNFSDDASTLVSASLDLTVRVWDTSAGEMLHTWQDLDQCAIRIILSPDGQVVTMTLSDLSVCTLSTLTGEKGVQSESRIHSKYRPRRNTLAALSNDGGAYAYVEYDPNSVREVNYFLREDDKTAQYNALVKGLPLTRLAFTDINESLDTNRGRLVIERKPWGWHKAFRAVGDIHFDTPWIQYRGKDVIWLPYHHRGTCIDERSEMIALGQDSGNVDFYRLRSP